MVFIIAGNNSQALWLVGHLNLVHHQYRIVYNPSTIQGIYSETALFFGSYATRSDFSTLKAICQANHFSLLTIEKDA